MPRAPPKAAAKAAAAAVVATPVPKAAVKAAGSKLPKAPKAVAKVPAEHADTAPVVPDFDMLGYLMAQNTDLPDDVALALENDLGDEASSAGPRVLLG